MLKKVTFENFKNFNGAFSIDFSNPKNYGFSESLVNSNTITKSIIYGPNGSGKSNLGLAIMDITLHLTDKEKMIHKYDLYYNLQSGIHSVSFTYDFEFDGIPISSSYKKSDPETILFEQLFINSELIIYYDFEKNEGFTKLEGTETLTFVSDSSKISKLKYIYNNAILGETVNCSVFKKLMEYVNRMLLFYSLDDRGYQGLITGREKLEKGIIESGKLKDFEAFLNDMGIHYSLDSVEVNGELQIYCNMGETFVDIFKIASTGTKSLILFYYWYIKMSEASFVFIDEFDAFYHFELARNLIRKLITLDKQQIVLTTHNTDLMTNDLLRPDCYYLIGEKRIIPLSDATEKELRKAHNLQKMYKAGAFRVD